MKTKISIHIDGPGGTHGAPVLVLREALEKLGFTVQVHDSHPMPENDARAIAGALRPFRGCETTITTVHHVCGG